MHKQPEPVLNGTYVKVKLWFDGPGRGHHCLRDDKPSKDTYDRTSGQRETAVEGGVCTSAPWRKNDLFRAIQIGVEAFNVQQGGYLCRLSLLEVHVAGSQEQRGSAKGSYVVGT